MIIIHDPIMFHNLEFYRKAWYFFLKQDMIKYEAPVN